MLEKCTGSWHQIYKCEQNKNWNEFQPFFVCLIGGADYCSASVTGAIALIMFAGVRHCESLVSFASPRVSTTSTHSTIYTD